MKLTKQLGALLLAVAAAISLAACGGNKPADAPSGASTSQAASQDPQAEKLDKFLREKLPKEYPASEKFACEVSATDGGHHAKLALDLGAPEFSEEEILDMIQLETIYLMTDNLSEPPSPLSYTLEYLIGGEVFATVDKPIDSNQCVLTYKGDATNFSF